jgi:hypothetical protein
VLPTLQYPAIVTASSIDRFFSCPGSSRLPRVTESSSAAALAGTAEHAARLVPGQLPRRVVEWFGREPGCEVALAADALDNSAAQFLGQFLERGYPLFNTPSFVGGTADVISMTDDVISVGDLKTGRGQARGSLLSPNAAGQLLCLAWLARQWRRLRQADWQPGRVRLMWWVTAEGRDDLWDAEIGAAELDAFASRLRRTVENALSTGPLSLRRSPHCNYCAAFDACPAQAGSIARLRGGVAVPDSDVGAAVLDLQHARKALDSAEQALKIRIERGLQNGTVFPVDAQHEVKLIRGSVSRIDVNVAARVLGDRFLDCATIEVSRTGMERALGQDGAATAIEQIAEHNGVVTTPRSPYLRVVKRTVTK